MQNGDAPKNLNFLGMIGDDSDNSIKDNLYALYAGQYNIYSSSPSWFPYTLFIDNSMIIGYETSNKYGAQIMLSHGSGIKLRTINVNGWNAWRTL